VLLLSLLALSVSADPDPPAVDGGNVTFDGDWTVDPGDDLLYVNQTIVLNGNLTVSPSGVLELVNCTLLLNGTPPTEYPMSGVRVGWDGTLNITAGSMVRPLFLAYFIVDAGAHLLVEQSTVKGIGHTAPLENSGVYIKADDFVIRNSTVGGGNHGLILDGVAGGVVENVSFPGPQRKGLFLRGGTSGVLLRDLTFTDSMESISVLNCKGVVVENVSISGSSYGVGVDNGSITLLNARVSDMVGGVVVYWTPGGVTWSTDGQSLLVNSTMEINGSLEVLSGGNLAVVNSTVSILNPAVNGANGIVVRSGGNMSVTDGSMVVASGGHRYEWTIEAGAGLVLDGATVSEAGWDTSHPGLVVHSSGNVLEDTTFVDCRVGITVTGDGNDASGLTFEDCTVGAVWADGDADLADLHFVNCSSQGLVISGAISIRVRGCQVSSGVASDGIALGHSSAISLQEVNVTGGIGSGIRMRNVSDVLVANSYVSTVIALEIEAWSPCSNITVDSTTLLGTSEAVDVDSVDGLKLLSVTARGSPFSAWFENVHDLEVRDCKCKITGGSGGCIRLVNSDDVVMDQTILDGGNYIVQMSGCHGVRVIRTQMVDGGYGLHASTTSLLDVSNVTIDTMTVWGIYLSNVLDFNLSDTLVLDAARKGATLGDSSRGHISNLTVSSSDLGIDVAGGDNVTFARLSLLSCAEGLRFRSMAAAMAVEASLAPGLLLPGLPGGHQGGRELLDRPDIHGRGGDGQQHRDPARHLQPRRLLQSERQRLHPRVHRGRPGRGGHAVQGGLDAQAHGGDGGEGLQRQRALQHRGGRAPDGRRHHHRGRGTSPFGGGPGGLGRCGLAEQRDVPRLRPGPGAGRCEPNGAQLHLLGQPTIDPAGRRDPVAGPRLHLHRLQRLMGHARHGHREPPGDGLLLRWRGHGGPRHILGGADGAGRGGDPHQRDAVQLHQPGPRGRAQGQVDDDRVHPGPGQH